MSRKVGQIIVRGEPRWLVRVYLGRDRDKPTHGRSVEIAILIVNTACDSMISYRD